MAAALEQFVKQLEDSGVISAGNLKGFIPPTASPKNAQELARQLVLSKQLTKYQVQEIYQGRAKSLILGNYTILDKIGAGGMGQVFKAEQRRMHRVVAIKVLPKNTMRDAAAIARFQREVEAAARLTHPNIVAAYDANEADGIHFLVMEYVEGSDLSALVKKDGRLSVSKAVDYTLQAAKGLQFAHDEHIVHRDIKPANLLLDQKGTVKILDMGLARIEAGADAGTQAELTSTGAVLGTVDYMAPEQGLSTKRVDGRADIYSLGCTLHFLLIGEPIYSGDSVMAKLLAHHQQPVPDLCKLRQDVGESLQMIFSKMVAKKVEDRFQTMGEVVAALESPEDFATGWRTSAFSQPSIEAAPLADTTPDALTFLNEITTRTTFEPKPKKKPPVAPPAALPGSPPDSLPAATDTGGVDEKLFSGKAILLALAAAVLAAVILAGVLIALSGNRQTTAATSGAEAGDLSQRDAPVQVSNKAGNVPTNIPGYGKPLNAYQDFFNGTSLHAAWVHDHGTATVNNGLTLTGGATLLFKPAGNSALYADGPVTISALVTINRVAADDTGRVGLTLAQEPAAKQNISFLARSEDHQAGANGVNSMRLLNENQSWGNASADRVWSNGNPYWIEQSYSPANGQVTAKMWAVTNGLLGSNPIADLSRTFNPVHGSGAGNGFGWAGFSVGGADSMTVNYVLIQSSSLPSIVVGVPPTANKPAFADAATAEAATVDNRWIKDVSGRPAEKQVEAVARKLRELNPGFDGHESHKVDSGVVTELQFSGRDVADLSPLRALAGLRILKCGDWGRACLLSDLSPLEGLHLVELDCTNAPIASLAPLKGMRLTRLQCRGAPLADLSPLARMPLTYLDCGAALIADLAALKALPLKELNFDSTAVSDLSPLKEMPLTSASFDNTQVSDLTPLRGKKLTMLVCSRTQVSVLSPLKGMPLTDLDCSRTQVFDLSPLQGMPLTDLDCSQTQVFDLSPLKGMPLKNLACPDTGISDLSPLRGLRLTKLSCHFTRISDLSPLQGMPLQTLDVSHTRVSDLSPLKGMPLTWLHCQHTRAFDLSPLRGAALAEIAFSPKQISKGLDSIRQMKSVDVVENDEGRRFSSDDFWEKYDAGEFLPWDKNPAFKKWMNDVAALPVDKQAQAVARKLQALNPEFDGNETHQIENGAVVEFNFLSDKSRVLNISPVRALTGLKRLGCNGTNPGGAPLFDLSPLSGLRLTSLNCGNSWVNDLSALAGMPLTSLICDGAPVYDLSPLRGMPLARFSAAGTQVADLTPLHNSPLTELDISNAPVSDVSPLQGLALTKLHCYRTRVTDLSPLEGMPLGELCCDNSKVSDLSPLKGAPLTVLHASDTAISDLSVLKGMHLVELSCDGTSVSDLSPLEGMQLTMIYLAPKSITKGLNVIRGMKSLNKIGLGWYGEPNFPPDEFWRKYDAGEFKN